MYSYTNSLYVGLYQFEAEERKKKTPRALSDKPITSQGLLKDRMDVTQAKFQHYTAASAISGRPELAAADKCSEDNISQIGADEEDKMKWDGDWSSYEADI